MPGLGRPGAAAIHVDPKPRLEVRGLSTSFATDAGRIQSVADVSFTIAPGETLALVGESGSGKSVTSLSLMGLHAKTSQARMDGEAWFVRRDGARVNLLALPEAGLRALRGNEMAMIFQEPMTSLNPVITVGDQIAESVRLHLKLDRRAALAHALRMLELVEIPAAARRLHEYPHQLSGGMRQRVMIALAMSCNPTLLIADEPLRALDVSIQAQVVNLLGELKEQLGLTILFISHDLDVVEYLCDRVVVLYLGRVMEIAPTHALYSQPQHPYTRALLAAAPVPDPAQRRSIALLKGDLPSPAHPPSGCVFRTRCPHAIDQCASTATVLREVRPDHWNACWRTDIPLSQ